MKPPSLLDKHLYTLVHYKRLLSGGLFKHSYSQWGEDTIIAKLLPQEKGLYVDVGAYHPFHYSNTQLLYRRGWHGINIDPNPNAILLFKRHRRRDININSGVCSEVTRKTYYIFNHQSCNTFSKIQRDLMLKKSFIRQIGEAEVPCVPLQKILDEHAPGQKVDFLNVDVEGMGLEVLQSLDWQKATPAILCIEKEEGVDAFLSARSYRLHATAGQSLIYIRA